MFIAVLRQKAKTKIKAENIKKLRGSSNDFILSILALLKVVAFILPKIKK